MDYLIYTEHFNILAKVQGMLLLTLNLFIFFKNIQIKLKFEG